MQYINLTIYSVKYNKIRPIKYTSWWVINPYVRTSFFWGFTRRVVVISYPEERGATSRRKPEITQPLHVSGPECRTEGIHLKKGTQAQHAKPDIDRFHYCH